MKCTRPGCDPPGEIDGGYCNRCGAPEAAVVVDEPAHAPTPATAAPRAPGTTGPRTATRASATRRSTTTTGDRLGGRRVELPPLEIREAVDAVLEHPSIPESKRFCGDPACNQPVGRSRDGRAGLTEGYCTKCNYPFSFSPKLVPGTVVGQYEIVGCIAHGGLGWIYLARDLHVDGRWVVLKGLLNKGNIDVINQELIFLAQIDHPNIVDVYNFVEHDQDPYIVMEYVRGSTLRSILEARKNANQGEPDPLPASHAITFMLSVLPAFGYLHAQGLLYCDFKPDNVIRTADSLKLIDMGAVYRMDDTTSAIYGTPGFQAPEIADTGPTVPSDLYTVGRTLAALCIHTRGFHSTYSRTLPPAEDIPLFQECDSLYRFLIRATAADPDDRFQSADEMAVQLGGVLREIVATESGSPWPEASSLFTGELRSGANEPADWRTLPAPLVATDDPAAGFLAALAAGVTPPDEVVELLAQAPERTVEVQLREVRALVEAERYAEADTVINEVALEDPWEWRAAWYSGIAALAQHDHDRALAEFRSVYATLPGELAPKVAMAQAAECDGDLRTAAHWYDIVSATDPGFTGAVFGLARCRISAGELEGAVAAYDRIPATSSSYVDAQVAKAESMLDGKGTPLTVDEIVAAGDVITPLPLPREHQARLTARILSAALELVDGAPSTDPAGAPTVLGYQLTETDVRLGLESTYRKLALQSPAGAERIALVDQANQLRPRTVW